MEIIYRSFDGKMFSTPEECLTHEMDHPLFRMFDNSGKQVTRPDDCVLLQIVNINGPAAFIELCESCGSDYGDFTSNESAGWYWWDGDEYGWIDPEMINALFRCNHYRLND